MFDAERWRSFVYNGYRVVFVKFRIWGDTRSFRVIFGSKNVFFLLKLVILGDFGSFRSFRYKKVILRLFTIISHFQPFS